MLDTRESKCWIRRGHIGNVREEKFNRDKFKFICTYLHSKEKEIPEYIFCFTGMVLVST